MPEIPTYHQLKEAGLAIIVPGEFRDIIDPEKPRTLYDMIEESAARATHLVEASMQAEAEEVGGQEDLEVALYIRDKLARTLDFELDVI